jgi:hypothetical protein
MTYSDAVKRFGDAVTELHDRITQVTRSESERLQAIAEQPRLSAESARLALEAHLQQHGCLKNAIEPLQEGVLQFKNALTVCHWNHEESDSQKFG